MFEKPEIAGWLRELAVANREQLPLPMRAVLVDMEAEAAERRFPIIGPEVGRLLFQLTRLRGAARIFELGSGFGYSTVWFASAAQRGFEVHHTDGSQENSDRAREYLKRAELIEGVVFHVGDALEALEATEGDFDIVFMDIDKHGYADAFLAFADRVRPGGLVITDNLMWSGKVATGETDPDTAGIRRYIELMWQDPRFFSSMLPVRDGVGVSVRMPS